MIGFKIIDFYRKTSIVKYYNEIFTEYSGSIKDLQIKQKKRLSFFLENLKSNNFYGKYLTKYSSIDINHNPELILKQLPKSNKSFIKRNYNLLYTDSFNNGKHEKRYTGGSTGEPFKYIMSKESISYTRAFNYFLWNRFLDYNLGDKILVLGGGSIGNRVGLKKYIYNTLQSKLSINVNNIGINWAQSVYSKIKNNKVKYIYAYPSILKEFVDIANNANWNLINKVYGIICTSEVLTDENKNIFEKVFHAKVLNIYGANDGGIMAGSVDNNKFYYNGLQCYVEENKKNDYTELLLTNLTSVTFPFVRYAVGDMANIVTNDNSFPFILANLKGRTRDFIINNNGEKFHGFLFNNLFKKYSFVDNYQIEQFEDLNVLLRLVIKDSHFITNYNDIIKDFSKQINDDKINISVKIVNSIKKSPSIKNKVIISHVL